MKQAKDFIAPRIAALPPSGIRKFFDIASRMTGVVSLSIGEPDFDTPWLYTRAGIGCLERGGTHYTSNRGRLELRKAISRYMERRFGVGYDPETQIVVTIGASEAIDLALRTVIDAGDEVLVPDPSYVSYMPNVVIAGGTAVPVPITMENGFILTPEALEKAVTPRTKALILPYPNNPTGGVMGLRQLEALARFVEKHDLLVISDEIYAELTYGDEKHVSFASLPGMYGRTLVVNGFSKAFAMTGWRVGFLCGDAEILAAANKIHQYVIMCVPTASQAAAEEALKAGFASGFSDVARMVAAYDRRRRLLVSRLNAVGYRCHEPLGAFYAYPSIWESGQTSEDFCTGLLNDKHVAVVPGNAFGPRGEGHVRISYAASEENINTALRRMEEYLNERRQQRV